MLGCGFLTKDLVLTLIISFVAPSYSAPDGPPVQELRVLVRLAGQVYACLMQGIQQVGIILERRYYKHE